MPAFDLVEPLSQSLPLWLLGFIVLVTAVLALEGGAWLARKHLARIKVKGEEETKLSDAQGYVIGAIFGLLAFLVGLTFSIALDRFDSRRGWVAEEATAINTAYLRASLFDEPGSSQLRSTIRDYARVRLAPDDITSGELARMQKESDAIRARLWEQTHEAVMPVRETDLGSSMVEAMNDMLEVGTRRQLAGQAHIPPQIIDIQLIYLIVAAGVLGYLLGMERNPRRYASSLLLFLFALAVVLILDIDRPRSGTINVSQQGLEELVAAMEADAGREARAPASSDRSP